MAWMPYLGLLVVGAVLPYIKMPRWFAAWLDPKKHD